MSIAFIGFGELAFELAKGVREGGRPDLRAYTRPRADQESKETLSARLAQADVRPCPTLHEAVAGAGCVIAAVPVAASRDVLVAASPHLVEDTIYVDPAPSSPEVKERAAELLAGRGVLYVDAAVLGTVAVDGHRVPILACGPGAVAWRELMTPFGMRISVIEGPAGRATLVKLLRSVYLKGRDALVVEMMLAARRHGVEELVLDSIGGPAESVGFRDLVARILCGVSVHAERRADELAGSAEVVRAADLEPTVTSAGSERLRWVAELGLREHFQRRRPQTLAEALAAMDVRQPSSSRSAQPRRAKRGGAPSSRSAPS